MNTHYNIHMKQQHTHQNIHQTHQAASKHINLHTHQNIHMKTNIKPENSFWNFDALFQPQQHPARYACVLQRV